MFPGQVLRGMVGAVTDGQITLDLGYATLTATAKGLDLQPGQRVLVQVGMVGPDQLTLQLLPDPGRGPGVAPAVSPTPQAILQGLGLPVDDALIGVVQQLQAQRGLQGMPPPLLAAFALAFGADATTIAPQVANLLRARKMATGEAPPAAAIQGSTASAETLLKDLAALLTGNDPAGKAETLPANIQQLADQPQSALSLALSALAGHQVRVHLAQDDGATLLIEEQPRPASDEPAAYRFLGSVELPALGTVGVQCLYAPAACIARITASADALPVLRPLLDDAQTTLQTRLGRPVTLATVAGEAGDPLGIWLAERPWERRGMHVTSEGGWVDRRV